MLNFILGSPLVLIVVVVVVVFLFKDTYIKAPPNKAAVISGLGKHPRVLIGKAGFKVPFLERVDWLGIGQIDIDITTEDYIPTSDFINIQADAVAQIAVDSESDAIQIAMRNFLNKDEDVIKQTIFKSLQGNLREIIGTMSLKDICQNKTQFSQEVKSNAEQDMAKLGIKILSFNVQNINDKDGLINDLGIDNRSQIQKDASIAKANAERDVEVASSEARNKSDEARVEAELAIAKRNNDLAIKKAELKITEDTKRAEADAAYEIQKQTSRKAIEIREQEADIARREKEIELQAKEAEVIEKKLDAEVRKKAEADKYAEMQMAEADLFKRQKDAEAKLFEAERDAQGIKAKGEAEADAIRQKGIAEAEALDKKAEAMKKYGEAAMMEMLVNVLPEIAKNVAEPLKSIDKVSIIGGDGKSVAGVSENVPVVMAQVFETVKESTGLDLRDVLKAHTYDAKVNRNLNVTGLSSEDAKEEVNKATKEFWTDDTVGREEI